MKFAFESQWSESFVPLRLKLAKQKSEQCSVELNFCVFVDQLELGVTPTPVVVVGSLFEACFAATIETMWYEYSGFRVAGYVEPTDRAVSEVVALSLLMTKRAELTVAGVTDEQILDATVDRVLLG